MPETTPQRGPLMQALFIAGGLVLYVLALMTGALFDLDTGDQSKSQERQR